MGSHFKLALAVAERCCHACQAAPADLSALPQLPVLTAYIAGEEIEGAARTAADKAGETYEQVWADCCCLFLCCWYPASAAALQAAGRACNHVPRNARLCFRPRGRSVVWLRRLARSWIRCGAPAAVLRQTLPVVQQTCNHQLWRLHHVGWGTGVPHPGGCFARALISTEPLASLQAKGAVASAADTAGAKYEQVGGSCRQQTRQMESFWPYAGSAHTRSMVGCMLPHREQQQRSQRLLF